jgi:hypothetical protein
VMQIGQICRADVSFCRVDDSRRRPASQFSAVIARVMDGSARLGRHPSSPATDRRRFACCQA